MRVSPRTRSCGASRDSFSDIWSPCRPSDRCRSGRRSCAGSPGRPARGRSRARHRALVQLGQRAAQGPTHSEPQCLQASAAADRASISAFTSSAGAFDRKAASSAPRCAAVNSPNCSTSDWESLAFLAPRLTESDATSMEMSTSTFPLTTSTFPTSVCRGLREWLIQTLGG